jgi:hypothetical protein
MIQRENNLYLYLFLSWKGFGLGFMGGQAECCACADTGHRTPIIASGNDFYKDKNFMNEDHSGFRINKMHSIPKF